ncbi:DUF1566 domain-containing protein [Patescibacteria group bacterium]|nr:DUF1566 domain-containing protein [Patescibacteria group bacterium]
MKLKIKDILKIIFKYIDRNINYVYIVVCIIFGITLGITLNNNRSYAEQMGSSPNTGGAQSVLVGSYNQLVSKGDNYGSSSSPNFTQDWGTYWNRIMYSATWEPQGTATSSDVLSNKTFISSSNDRTSQSGTKPAFDIDYSLQQYVKYDDYHASSYTGADSTWIQTSSATSAHVWQDTRTGLYWSYSLGSYTNSFSVISSGSCPFFDSTPRSSYTSSNTSPACGNAINACATLSLASTEGQSADTDWYLPSYAELDGAYINGIYNQAGSTFTTTTSFWSSTEDSSGSTRAWGVSLRYGLANYNVKTLSFAVRCVRRD